jgi:acetylglutamate kinase
MRSQAHDASRKPDQPRPVTWGTVEPGVPEIQPEARGDIQPNGTIVVKIGGSTLGEHDTALHDVVALQRKGIQAVVVHGGGKVISEWMEKQGVRPRFVRGLRVTDARSLEIVVAVLTGLINKSLVASIQKLGGRAIGISGADGGMLEARVKDPELGLVGEVVKVNPEAINAVVAAECIPVVAPVAVQTEIEKSAEPLLNVNADTVAGQVAAALGADRLVFLTDVEGVLDSSRRLIPRLTARQARGLLRSNIVAGGMVPKLEGCLTALDRGGVAQIVDGRQAHALMDLLSGETMGTRVG